MSHPILTEDDKLLCTGLNESGELGLGSYDNCNIYTEVNVTFPVKKVKSKYGSSYILDYEGNLWSSGSNTFGKLGLDTDSDHCTFQKINYSKPIIDFSIGHDILICINKDGELVGCGNNYSGSIGIKNDCERISTLTKIQVEKEAKKIFCTKDSSFCIDYEDKVWCCGDNQYGQLGLKIKKNNILKFTQNNNFENIDMISGDVHTFLLDNDGYIWGCSEFHFVKYLFGRYCYCKNDFVKYETKNIFKKISCGLSSNLALTKDQKIFGYGSNFLRELGMDYRDKKFYRLLEKSCIDCYINSLSTYVLDNKNRLWVCGDNSYGNLGLGHYEDVENFTRVKIKGIKSIS